jgi:hypothetical protein
LDNVKKPIGGEVNELDERLRVTNCTISLMLGTFPDKALPETWKSVSEVKLSIKDGIVPERPFDGS